MDSPLALNVTDVFQKHAELFDEETRRFLIDREDPFGFKRLTYVRDVEASKALNDLRSPYMVIASSGMCEAGRILHHLKNNIEEPKNTVLLTGYHTVNTLGWKIARKTAGSTCLRPAHGLAIPGGEDGRIERARRSAGAAALDETNRKRLETGVPGSW